LKAPVQNQATQFIRAQHARRVDDEKIMDEGLEKDKGKKIFVILKSGRVYGGKIIDVDDGLVEIKDKFNKCVKFAKNEISSIEYD